MTALTLIRSGVFGAVAVVAPAAVLFLASGFAWSSDLGALVPYTALLGIVLAVVAALAWACVRLAGFGPSTAVILTTMPFIAMTVLTIPISLAAATRLGLAAVIPVLFWAGQLAAAVLVARAATRRALL
jgi:membrane protein insertase Oxa1/YidC/SpoIIIJ